MTVDKVPGYTTPTTVTKGYKTTEFWMTLVTTVFTLLNQSGALGNVVIPPETVAIYMAPMSDKPSSFLTRLPDRSSPTLDSPLFADTPATLAGPMTPGGAAGGAAS